MKLVGDRLRISTVHLTIPVIFWNSVAKLSVLKLCTDPKGN